MGYANLEIPDSCVSTIPGNQYHDKLTTGNRLIDGVY